MTTLRKKPPIRIVEVKRSTRLTPNMQRITFTGQELIGFPSDRNGANLKLLLPEKDMTKAKFREALVSSIRPTARTFTVRHYRKSDNELDIDFVAHGDEGPASSFALHCQSGDIIGLAGPGPLKLNRLDADYFLFCADMSALPAAAASIEMLPGTARGFSFFEITDPKDRYPLTPPPGIEVNWLVHPSPHEVSYQQLECLKSLDWPIRSLSIFAAGEHTSTMAIRDFVLNEKKVVRKDIYVSGYWKIGLVEDEHQIEKRKKADT